MFGSEDKVDSIINMLSKEHKKTSASSVKNSYIGLSHNNISVFDQNKSENIVNDNQEKKDSKNRIKYEVLTDIDKDRLSRYNIKKINSLHKEAKFKLLFRKLERFVKGNENQTLCSIINPKVYEIIGYLKEHGLEHKGLFRVPGSSSTYKDLVNRLIFYRSVRFQDYTMDDLASALKTYIRESLGGIIPRSICDSLIKAYKNKDRDLIDRIKVYLPFVLLNDFRKLNLKMIDLFNGLDKKSAINFMPLSNIAFIMPCVFFPEQFCTDYKTALIMSDILKDFFKLDYKTLPVKLYIEFKNLNPKT